MLKLSFKTKQEAKEKKRSMHVTENVTEIFRDERHRRKRIRKGVFGEKVSGKRGRISETYVTILFPLCMGCVRGGGGVWGGGGGGGRSGCAPLATCLGAPIKLIC